MSTETNTIEFHGVSRDAYLQILTPGALEYVTILQREFGARRKDLLGDRAARLERLNAGEGSVALSRKPLSHTQAVGWTTNHEAQLVVASKVNATEP